MSRYTPLWLQAGSYAASVDRRLLQALWPAAATVGGAVTATTGMVLQAAAGQAAVPVTGGGTVLCPWDAPETVTLDPAPAAGVNRIDLVVCQARGNDLDGGVNNDFVITFAKGAEAASPAAPAVPANAVALAQVAVAGGAASITAANITDRRPGSLAVPPTPFAPVRFKATQSPAQSIPRIAWTTVTAWAAPSENVGGGSFSAGVYTFPAAGRYMCVGCTMWQVPSTTGAWGMQQQFAGNPAGGGMSHLYLVNPGNSNTMQPVSLLTLSAQAGDTIALQIYNGHPSAAVPTFAGYAWMAIDRIG